MENPSKARQYTAKAWLKWIVPVALSVLVSIMGFFPGWIESNYSTGIYPYTGRFQRLITGWLPFSLGDLAYFILGAWLAFKIFTTLRDAFRRRITWHKTLRRTFRLARLLMWTYIIFMLAWGWNYSRKGLEYQLQLPVRRSAPAELKQVLDQVVTRLNENRRLISTDTVLREQELGQLREGATKSYQLAAKQFGFLSPGPVSIKKSMYSAAAQYFGFTGYYNPFSGEAQLRTHLPNVMMPFVLCHEIGHQLGYAKEDEASFAGYLAATASPDPYFRYSTYLELYTAVRTRLIFASFARGDTAVSGMLRDYHQRLDTLVRFDRRKIREYFRRSRTPLSDQMSSVMMGMYEQYLRANKQARGLESYDDVVSLLVAYRRKYGRI